MAHYLEFTSSVYNLDHDEINNKLNYNLCVCCLTQNKPFVNLSKCKHVDFFQYYFKFKMEAYACVQCHSFLKKIDSFRQQVKESIEKLSNQVPNISLKTKLHSLQRSYTEISSAINSESIQCEIRNESAQITNQNENFDILTEVKIEYDSSDLETTVPLAQIKKESRKTRMKALAAPQIIKQVKKSSVNKKRLLVEEKYAGKIKVVMLTKEDMLEERVRAAAKGSYLNLPYKCEDCILGFDYEEILREHIEKKHIGKKGSYQCEICKSVLGSEASLRDHLKRHARRYECMVCGKRGHNVQTIIKHYSEQHGKISPERTCTICAFTTDSYRIFKYHREKHKEKPQCNVCGKTFVNTSGLKVHMLSYHKQSSRIYSCGSCNKVYRTKSGLNAHNSIFHSTQKTSTYCEKCRVHFKSKQNLAVHIRTHSNHVTDMEKRFVCDECGAKFLNKYFLQVHIDWVHLKSEKHKCDKCAKVFPSITSLKRHIKGVHEKVRPPRNKICDYCGRLFTTLAILQSHIRTHTGERPHKCRNCGATFAHSGALYTHMKLLHSGNKAPQ